MIDINKADMVKQRIMPDFQLGVVGASPTIRSISFTEARPIIEQKHYLHCWPLATQVFGLFSKEVLVGVAVYGPASLGLVTRWGARCDLHNTAITELKRLWVSDVMPHNTETWFLGRTYGTLRRAGYKLVVSLADLSVGHHGGIYKAAGFTYVGTTERRHDYYLPNGKKVERFGAIKKGHLAVLRPIKNVWLFPLVRAVRSKVAVYACSTPLRLIK